MCVCLSVCLSVARCVLRVRFVHGAGGVQPSSTGPPTTKYFATKLAVRQSLHVGAQKLTQALAGKSLVNGWRAEYTVLPLNEKHTALPLNEKHGGSKHGQKRHTITSRRVRIVKVLATSLGFAPTRVRVPAPMKLALRMHCRWPLCRRFAVSVHPCYPVLCRCPPLAVSNRGVDVCATMCVCVCVCVCVVAHKKLGFPRQTKHFESVVKAMEYLNVPKGSATKILNQKRIIQGRVCCTRTHLHKTRNSLLHQPCAHWSLSTLSIPCVCVPGRPVLVCRWAALYACSIRVVPTDHWLLRHYHCLQATV